MTHPTHIAIIGGGTMGNGIAQTAAISGYTVTLVDSFPAALERASATIEASITRMHSKGKLTDEQVAAARAIAMGSDLALAHTADLVIEAVPENLDLKRRIFTDLDHIAPPHAILASNTSSISITALGAATRRPEKVVGLHFFNPVAVMALVEVIPGQATDPTTIDTVTEFARRLGKTPVRTLDSAGFIVNRLLCPMLNEAIFALQEGLGTKEDIDTAMKLGASHPMGPLELADYVGLDVLLDVMTVLHTNLGEDKYRPAPLLRRMVAAGHLGRKTGRGFYTYG